MKLFVVLSALLAMGYSAPKDLSVGSSSSRIDHPHLTDAFSTIDFESLPDNYSNSTHQVEIVDGARIEVNRTVGKSSSDGTFFAQVLIKVSPDHAEDTKGLLSEGDELDDSLVVNRHRRGLFEWLEKSFSFIDGNAFTQEATVSKGHEDTKTVSEDKTDDASKTKPEPSSIPDSETAAARNDVTFIGDTNVNYLGAQPRENSDAEIFDINLVREDADRFFASRPQPMRSQPMRSQPMRSQPMRSQPMMSQPMRSQPIMSQPMRSQPMRSQPMMSQPMRSQPIMSQPIRSQPMRSQAMRHQPIRSHPRGFESIRLSNSHNL